MLNKILNLSYLILKRWSKPFSMLKKCLKIDVAQASLNEPGGNIQVDIVKMIEDSLGDSNNHLTLLEMGGLHSQGSREL